MLRDRRDGRVLHERRERVTLMEHARNDQETPPNRKARQADEPVAPNAQLSMTQQRLLLSSVGFSPIPVLGKAPKVTGWQMMINVGPGTAGTGKRVTQIT